MPQAYSKRDPTYIWNPLLRLTYKVQYNIMIFLTFLISNQRDFFAVTLLLTNLTRTLKRKDERISDKKAIHMNYFSPKDVYFQPSDCLEILSMIGSQKETSFRLPPHQRSLNITKSKKEAKTRIPNKVISQIWICN